MKSSTVTTLSMENETNRPKPSETGNASSTATATGKKVGMTNEVFEDSTEQARRSRTSEDDQVPSSSHEPEEHFAKVHRPRTTEVRNDERDRGYEANERQMREYAAQNLENGRLRDSQRYRDPEREKIGRSGQRNDRDDGRIFYQGQDFRQRPVDEMDTPLFPATRETMPEPMFAKIVNPSVKIMRVDRENEEPYDTR